MQSRGVAYMAASALAFSVMAALVKLASETLPTGEIVLARALVTLVLSYVLIRRAGLPPWGTRKGRLLLRGVLGFSALACYYISVSKLPLAESTTLQNTTPVITALLAWRLLGEHVGWAAGFAMACGLAGVTLVAHPSGAGADPTGVAIGVTGAVCSSIAYVTVRSLSRHERPLVIVFYFSLVATPLAVPWAAVDFQWPDSREWLLLAGIGVATQLGQMFMTMGLALERAARATSVSYLQIAFSMIWQLVLFGQPPALATILGAALIVAGAFAVSATAGRSS